MIPTRPLRRVVLTNFSLILLRHFTFAALQNVTVDDAAQIGSVIPQYLPSTSDWNIGNNCSKCLAKPDPSRAYNGTWHDTTFYPNNGISQKIEFTFIGSALYIFFILANSVPNATTLTDLKFHMDNILVGTYAHSPTTSADYEYNVPVYFNESIFPGEHTVMIKPVHSTEEPILMLFDYLIYTSTGTDDGTTASPFVSSSTSATLGAPSSSISSGAQGTSPRQNTAAIVGGTVGGVAGLVLAILLPLWYKRRQKRSVKRVQLPSFHSRDIPLQDSSRTPKFAAPPFAQRRTIYDADTSLARSRSPSPPISIDPPSTASLIGGSNGLMQQLEQLRAEISRLRYLQYQNRDPVDLGTKVNPTYK